jgi:hypothetical protein
MQWNDRINYQRHTEKHPVLPGRNFFNRRRKGNENVKNKKSAY